MKQILLAIFLLTLSLGRAFTVEHQEIEQEKIIIDIRDATSLFEFFWSGDEEDLYFNLNFVKGFVFDEDYVIGTVKNGCVCEISCHPEPGYAFLLRMGFSLKKLQSA